MRCVTASWLFTLFRPGMNICPEWSDPKWSKSRSEWTISVPHGKRRAWHCQLVIRPLRTGVNTRSVRDLWLWPFPLATQRKETCNTKCLIKEDKQMPFLPPFTVDHVPSLSLVCAALSLALVWEQWKLRFVRHWHINTDSSPSAFNSEPLFSLSLSLCAVTLSSPHSKQRPPLTFSSL